MVRVVPRSAQRHPESPEGRALRGDTFGRVFAALDPDEFEKAFRMWVDAVAETPVGEHHAIDGKTVRRSFDAALGRAAVHMVSAWVYENHACFGQVKVDEKSNEITRRLRAGPTSDADASGGDPEAPRGSCASKARP
jgi:hypothetical protein